MRVTNGRNACQRSRVYMIMTGGFGTMIGTLWAQMVVKLTQHR